MNLVELLSIIDLEYFNKTSKVPTKTKLLKLLYLVDLSYYRNHRQRLFQEDWIYLLYGPYLENYDELLSSPPLKISETQHEEKTYQYVDITNKKQVEDILLNTDFDIKRVVKNVLADFAEWDLNKILNFIYFETEPMINAKNRGEKLDFSSVQSADEIKIKEIKFNPKIIKALKIKYKERLKNVRKI